MNAGLEVDESGGSRLLSMAVSASASTVLDAYGDSLELSVVANAVEALRGRYIQCRLLGSGEPRVAGCDTIEVIARKIADGLSAELNEPTRSGHRWLCSFMEPHGTVYASTAASGEIRLLWQGTDVKESGKSVLTPALARGWVEYFERAQTADKWTAVPAPSSRKLMVVVDTFALAGRGLILAPEVALDAGQHSLAVGLRRPDGSTRSTEALVQVPFIVPTDPTKPRARGHVLTLQLDKADVPLGTEVWLLQ